MPVYTVTSSPTFLDIRKRTERGRVALRQSQQHEMQTLGRKHRDRIRQMAPKKTGEFAAGINYSVSGSGDSSSFSISIPQPLGKWLRPPGTKAHTITAKRAKFLRFEVGGTVVYAKSVRHPGYRPSSDFVEDAVDSLEGDRRLGLRRMVKSYTAELIK